MTNIKNDIETILLDYKKAVDTCNSTGNTREAVNYIKHIGIKMNAIIMNLDDQDKLKDFGGFKQIREVELKLSEFKSIFEIMGQIVLFMNNDVYYNDEFCNAFDNIFGNVLRLIGYTTYNMNKYTEEYFTVLKKFTPPDYIDIFCYRDNNKLPSGDIDFETYNCGRGFIVVNIPPRNLSITINDEKVINTINQTRVLITYTNSDGKIDMFVRYVHIIYSNLLYSCYTKTNCDWSIVSFNTYPTNDECQKQFYKFLLSKNIIDDTITFPVIRQDFYLLMNKNSHVMMNEQTRNFVICTKIRNYYVAVILDLSEPYIMNETYKQRAQLYVNLKKVRITDKIFSAVVDFDAKLIDIDKKFMLPNVIDEASPLYNQYSKINDFLKIIPNSESATITASDLDKYCKYCFNNTKEHAGGYVNKKQLGGYFDKYMKYKSKYLNLKNIKIIK